MPAYSKENPMAAHDTITYLRSVGNGSFSTNESVDDMVATTWWVVIQIDYQSTEPAWVDNYLSIRTMILDLFILSVGAVAV